ILKESCIEIDRVVTMDITRLSRFGNSLNMKAGLRVVEITKNIDPKELSYSTFSPFKGFVKIKPVASLNNILVLDQRISIKKGDVIKLEAELAIYLVLKKLAVPIDASDLEVKV
ncbi:MAG: DNA primase, partial [Desulfurococcaceae archaeon]